MKQLLIFLLLFCYICPDSAQAQNPQYYLYHYPNKGGLGFGGGYHPPNFTGSKWQCIYYPSDFPTMPAGPVKNMYVKMYNRHFDSVSVYYNLTIKIGYTSKAGFTTGGGYDNFIPNLPLKFHADTMIIPPCDSNLCWLKIPLQASFSFSKGENFVVEYSMGGPGPLNGFQLNFSTGFGSPPRAMGGHRDSSRSTTRTAAVADLGFDRLTTGVDDVRNILSFGLFPNPSTDGRFNISFDAAKAVNAASVSVTDVTGRQVFRRQYQAVGASFFKEVRIAPAARGTYFLEVEADGERIARTVVIE